MNEENPNPKKVAGSRDADGRRQRFWVGYGMTLLVLGVMVITLLIAVARLRIAYSRQEVSVYASQDQVYAEPILAEFEARTHIRVRAIYDSESVKTVGLVNRLIAETDRPQCDVFWNNEELRTRQLAAKGVLEKWAAVGHRSRRIAINTNNVAPAAAPRSLVELTNQTWRGKVALAYPLYGTTATHFLALRQRWGQQRWLNWCRALAANKPLLVDGNSVAARLVAQGEAWIGLTDSDDIAAEQREGAPIAPLPLTEESLLIPNTVAVVRGARHPEAADKLFDYLQRPDVLDKLLAARALESVSTSTGPNATLQADWGKLLVDLDTGTAELKRIFLR